MNQKAGNEQPAELVPEGAKAMLPNQMPQLLQLLGTAVSKPDLSPEILDRYVDLQIKVMAHQAKMDYAVAMNNFQSKKEIISHNRTGDGPGGSLYGYADYPQMVKAVTPWLRDCGLSFSHKEDAPEFHEGKLAGVVVWCTIKHISGHEESFGFPAVPDERLKGKVSPSQLIQMAITYAKRQTLAMGLGLATAEDRQDDDAHSSANVITDEQAVDIQSLIEEVGANEEVFLKFIKAESVAQIKAKDFERACAALRRKGKQK